MLKRQASQQQQQPVTAPTSSRRPPAALQMTSSTTGTALTHSGETVSGESLITAPDDSMVTEPGSFVDVTSNGLVMPKAAFAREGYHSPSSSTSSLRSFGPVPHSRRSSGYSQFARAPPQPDLSNPYRESYERPLDTVKRLSRQADQTPQWIPTDASSIWPDAMPLVQPLPTKSRSSISLHSLSGRTRAPASPAMPPPSMSRKSSMASTTSPPTAYSIQRDFLSSLAPREGGYAIAAMTRSPSAYDQAATYHTPSAAAAPPLPSANSSRPSLQETSSASLSTVSQPTAPQPAPAPTLSKTPSPLSQAVTASDGVVEPEEDHLEMRTRRPAPVVAASSASSPLARPPIGRQGSTATARQPSQTKKDLARQRKEQEALAKQRREQEALAAKQRKKQEKLAAERDKLERERQRAKEKAEKQRAMAEAKRQQQQNSAPAPKRMNSLRSAVFNMPATPLKGKTKQLSVPPLTPGASAPSTPAQRALRDAELSDDPAASPKATATPSAATAPLPPPPVDPQVLALPPPRSVSKPPGTAFPPPKLATEPAATHPAAQPAREPPKRRKSIWGLFKRFGGSQKSESSKAQASTGRVVPPAPPPAAAPLAPVADAPAVNANGLLLHEDEEALHHDDEQHDDDEEEDAQGEEARVEDAPRAPADTSALTVDERLARERAATAGETSIKLLPAIPLEPTTAKPEATAKDDVLPLSAIASPRMTSSGLPAIDDALEASTASPSAAPA